MLKEAISSFFSEWENIKAEPFGSGHINDTYRLTISGRSAGTGPNAGVTDMGRDEIVNIAGKRYILQRINGSVFPDPVALAETHLKIEQRAAEGSSGIKIASIVPNLKGNYITFDSEGNGWRLTTYIDNSYSVDVASERWHAHEAGRAWGWFAATCSDLDASGFSEPIENFHRLSFRLKQLESAISENRAGRRDESVGMIEFYMDIVPGLLTIDKLYDQGELPRRVVHNDTKINNLLFRDKRAVAVIDLDTAGQGTLLFDYGDALRTTASTSDEDEQDISKAGFSLNAFVSFTRGYLQEVSHFITQTELKWLHTAPLLMSTIIGIRFLTDYLNGDIYYKTARPSHNIDRCAVQRAIAESVINSRDEMKSVVDEIYSGLQ